MTRRLLLLACVAAAFGLAQPVMSPAFPERPVTILVPFAPGGANDVVVRVIQPHGKNRTATPC
jgi:tripartite-type tricarboxylate transporter receptor subunit TctC